MRTLFIGLIAAAIISGCAHAQAGQTPDRFNEQSNKQTNTKSHLPDNSAYRVYHADGNSMDDIDKALSQARNRNTKLMVVMGANWCHDSVGFAARMDKPRFKSLIKKKYELVYVNAGTQPRQKDQNRAVSKRFGVAAIAGTPTVFIVDADGIVLNPDSVGYWRYADSIPEDMSYAYLSYYADK